MLIKLIPEQVSEGWQYIGNMIEKSIAPIGIANEETMSNVLAAILTDQLVCWMWMADAGPKALITTCVVQDPITNISSLLIYSLFGDGLSKEDMEAGITKLKEYAKGIECTFLSAYTILPSVAEIVKATGGTSHLTYVNWRL